MLVLLGGDVPACNYNVNGHDYTIGYYLADLKIKITIFFPKLKKHAESILRGYSVCCKFGLSLFEVLMASGIRNLSEIS